MKATQAKYGRIRLTIGQVANAAEEQSSWRGWYTQHEQTLVKLFDSDAPLFQKLLSATSQAASVPANVGLALKAYRQFKNKSEFTGYLPAVIKNLNRIRDEEALRGAKIVEYDKANIGDSEAIAIDRHIAMLFFNAKSPNTAQITSAKNRIKKVASRLGWQPRQVQASLWAFNQVRLGKNPSEIVSYDTILERKAGTIAELRAH